MKRLEQIEEQISEARSEIKKLESKIETLKSEKHRIGDRYWGYGGEKFPCPKCGCTDTPKGGGFANVESVKCPDCEYEVSRWN